jgi:hypothetical protein
MVKHSAPKNASTRLATGCTIALNPQTNNLTARLRAAPFILPTIVFSGDALRPADDVRRAAWFNDG